MDVDHGEDVEHVGLDQPAEGDDHAELGPGLDGIVDAIGHGQPELEGRRLDRTRHDVAASTPALVRPRDHQANVVAVGDEGPQRRDGERRRAEVDELRQCASARGALSAKEDCCPSVRRRREWFAEP